jgi:hypothetical protein
MPVDSGDYFLSTGCSQEMSVLFSHSFASHGVALEGFFFPFPHIRAICYPLLDKDLYCGLMIVDCF